MTNMFNGLSESKKHDILDFQSKVEADDAAKRRKPSGIPTRIDDKEYVFFSWNEKTTSLGVGLWIQEQSLHPVLEQDLSELLARGYPTDDQALVALGGSGNHIHVLYRRNGESHIDKAERVIGTESDLWYIGADWNPGVIFPTKRKS